MRQLQFLCCQWKTDQNNDLHLTFFFHELRNRFGKQVFNQLKKYYMIGYMQPLWFSHFLFEKCGSQVATNINPMFYEVETWISDSTCQMKLKILWLCLGTFSGRLNPHFSCDGSGDIINGFLKLMTITSPHVNFTAYI